MLTHPNDRSDESAMMEVDLQQVAALTARMLEASEQEDWNLVSDLEAQRFDLLSRLPPACFATDQATVQAILRDALASTQRITDRIRRAQAAEREILQTIRHGSRGALSYLAVAASP